MDEEKAKEKFEDEYAERLGMSYEFWQTQAPKNQQEAFARANAIDKELERTYGLWFEATGEEKEKLQDYRDFIKAEYQWLVDYFALESEDRSW